MTWKNWTVLLAGAVMASLGVYLGADVPLDSWQDMNVPRLVLGAIVAFLGSVVSFISTPPVIRK
jgi:uncharacterized membrane protein